MSGTQPAADGKLRATYVTLLILSLLFTLYEELFLRRWLFHRYGRGSILAGSLPNFLAVLVLSFTILTVNPTQNHRAITRAILSIMIGLALYEVAQIWMPQRVFDWNDLGATLLGGLFVWLVAVTARGMMLKPNGGAGS